MYVCMYVCMCVYPMYVYRVSWVLLPLLVLPPLIC